MRGGRVKMIMILSSSLTQWHRQLSHVMMTRGDNPVCRSRYVAERYVGRVLRTPCGLHKPCISMTTRRNSHLVFSREKPLQTGGQSSTGTNGGLSLRVDQCQSVDTLTRDYQAKDNAGEVRCISEVSYHRVPWLYLYGVSRPPKLFSVILERPASTTTQKNVAAKPQSGYPVWSIDPFRASVGSGRTFPRLTKIAARRSYCQLHMLFLSSASKHLAKSVISSPHGLHLSASSSYKLVLVDARNMMMNMYLLSLPTSRDKTSLGL